MANFTVGPSSTYASLSAALSAAISAHTDPDTHGEAWVFQCEAFVDSAAKVTFGASLSTDSFGITVEPQAGADHGGVEGTGYRLARNESSAVMFVQCPNVTLRGFTIDNTDDTNGFHDGLMLLAGDGALPENCLVDRMFLYAANTPFEGLRTSGGTTPFTVTVRNCLAHATGSNNVGIGFNTSSGGTYGTYYFDNCAAVSKSGGAGIETGFYGTTDNTFCRNCFVAAFSLGFDSGTNNTGTSNNAATDTTARGPNSVQSVDTATAFIDYTGGDFHLESGGALTGAGINLSADFTTDIAGNTRDSTWDIGPYAFAGAADTTAPTLTSPTGTETGTTTADGTVSTDEANGTLDAVVTTSATTPSAAQIQAGEDHTGSAAVATDLNNTVSATGSQAVSFTGLTSSTTYYVHYVHEDAAANVSTAVSSASFTTDAADVTAPTLSSGSGTATGQTTADLDVSTDESGGTLYTVVTTSATEPSVAQVKAGQDHTGSAAVFDTSQSVSATGNQDIAATGFTAATTYYAHFVHTDAAANDSTVLTTASFETDAVTTQEITFSVDAPTGMPKGSFSFPKICVGTTTGYDTITESFTGISSDTDGLITLSLTAGHGLTAGDYVWVWSAEETGTPGASGYENNGFIVKAEVTDA